MTTRSKKGRKAAFYRCPWNNTVVNDLVRQTDRRWRIVSTGQRFSEQDEREAVRRFYGLTAAPKATVTIDLPDDAPRGPLPESLGELDTILRETLESMRKGLDGPLAGLVRVRMHPTELKPQLVLDESAYWVQVAKDLNDRPQYAARMTGIEWLAWHKHDLPAESPLIQECVDKYVAKPGLSHDEQVRARVRLAEFCRLADVKRLGDVTHEAVGRYEAAIGELGLSPKSIRHRFSMVKTVVAYAMRRGVVTTECRRALDVLMMLNVPDATPLAPHPISPADFWAFHRAAVAANDPVYAAMLLVMLNLCMYPGEVAALKWAELNLRAGEVVTARPKTGVARVGVLWPETIKALKALPRERDEVFRSDRRSYTSNMVWKHWIAYRKQVKLPDVKPSDIRDAGYTVACRAVTLDKAKILAGHRLPGSTDHYVQRNPGFVKEACAAIRTAYQVARHA